MFLPALALLAASIHTDFEGGSLGKVVWVSGTHARCAVAGESDQDKRNRQANWYFFRVDGAKGQELTIDLVDLPGEYNYKPNRGAVTQDTIPVYSEDGGEWRHLDRVDYDPQEPRLRLRIKPAADRVWIAHVPPYTNRDLDKLLAEFRRHPHLRRAVIGRSVEGREILLLTVTNPAIGEASKRIVWLMARQHSWEAGSSWAAEGALRFLLSAEASRLRDEAIFLIFPMCDPDGVARGGVRFNRHGYDLNRNWDRVDADRMPEIAAQRKAVLEWVDAGRRLDLFLSLHNTETGEYLEGPPDDRHAALRDRFFRMLKEATDFNPTQPARSGPPSSTPGMAGRMGVHQGLSRDRDVPAFVMEQMIAYNSKLGRLPTAADRLRFGASLARAMIAAASIAP
ncbi:MAG: hypothetical protein HYR60_30505 [Acidobacteria bacterium]|nr:hypothetical protein [Acidobacteriota bacterium]